MAGAGQVAERIIASSADASPDAQGHVRLISTAAWRDALVAWVAQRLLFALMTLLGGLLILGHTPSAAEIEHIWARWDAAYYGQIAQIGYTRLLDAAFFPLFPLSERALIWATGGDALLAGVIVANSACLVAFGLLRIFVERMYGRVVAQRTLLYLAIFPVACYLAAAYAESLFLLLSVAAFLALRQRRWLLAGAIIALATLTRPVGVLLTLALVVEYSQTALPRQGDHPRMAWVRLFTPRIAREVAPALAMPLVALAAFMLYLRARLGLMDAPAAAQAAGWGRRLSWPWDGFGQALGAIAHDAPPFKLHAALDIGFTALFIALALLALRYLPRAEAAYSCATLALALLTPMHKYAWAGLGSNARFLLVLFPLFALLARWGVRNHWAHRAIVTVSLLLTLLLMLEFVGGAFVA